jgi:hypothetical protein
MEFGKHPGGILDKEHSFIGTGWNGMGIGEFGIHIRGIST